MEKYTPDGINQLAKHMQYNWHGACVIRSLKSHECNMVMKIVLEMNVGTATSNVLFYEEWEEMVFAKVFGCSYDL